MLELKKTLQISIPSVPPSSPRAKTDLLQKTQESIFQAFGWEASVFVKNDTPPSLDNCSQNMKALASHFLGTTMTHLLFVEDDVVVAPQISGVVANIISSDVNNGYVTFYLPGIMLYEKGTKAIIRQSGGWSAPSELVDMSSSIANKWYGTQCILIPRGVAEIATLEWIDGQAIDVTLKNIVWKKFGIKPFVHLPNLAQHNGVYKQGRSGYREGYTRHQSVTFVTNGKEGQ